MRTALQNRVYYMFSHYLPTGAKFPYVSRDTEYFHMTSELSGRSLDIEGFRRKAGAPVIAARPNGCVTQQWYEDMRGGIRSRFNDFALSVPCK